MHPAAREFGVGEANLAGAEVGASEVKLAPRDDRVAKVDIVAVKQREAKVDGPAGELRVHEPNSGVNRFLLYLVPWRSALHELRVSEVNFRAREARLAE